MKTIRQFNLMKFTRKPARPAVDVLRNESGIALIAALLLMVAMITIIPVAMHMTSTDINRTAAFEGNREAFYIADAGLQHAGALYQLNNSNDILRGVDDDFSATNDNGLFHGSGQSWVISGGTLAPATSKIDDATHNYTQVSFNGGNYKIRLWDNDDGALCPSICSAGNADPTMNTNNEKWVDRDGMVYAESIGTTGAGETVSIRATFKRKTIPPSFVPAAVVLVGPKASIYASSANYDVTGAAAVGGSGYGISGSADSECTGKAGIAIEAGGLSGLSGPQQNDFNTTLTTTSALDACENPTPPHAWNDVCVSLTTNARKSIEGTNSGGGTMASPNPDISVNDQTFTGDDAAKLYEDIITNGTPDQTLANPAVSSSISNWGSVQNPVVVYAPGNLVAAGNNTGYGILVIDGEFQMGGILTWNGIVLISACPTCAGKLTGVGTLTVNGTVIIGNNSTNRSITDFNGTARFNYSCEGINIANGAYKDTFQIVTWNEVNK